MKFSRYRKLLKNTLYSIFIFSFTGCFSQKNIENQSLMWFRYQLNIALKNQWSFSQSIENRFFNNPWRQSQFLMRTEIGKKLNHEWETKVLFTYAEQAFPQNPDIIDYYTLTELRLTGELNYSQKIRTKFRIKHRYWNEFRFMEQETGKIKYNNIRTRYRLELSYFTSNKVALKVFEEILLNISSSITYNVFDQNRVGVGVRYNFSENTAIETEYINWFQQRASGVDFYNRNIVRLSLIQKIN